MSIFPHPAPLPQPYPALYGVPIPIGGLTMAGYVRTNEKCPLCHEKFTDSKIGRERVFLCPAHQTMPRRCYVDTSGFGLKTRKLYKNRDGKVFASREAAEQFLDSMRVAKSSRAGFDPADWEPSRLREFRFDVEWGKWTEARSIGDDRWSAKYTRQVENARKRFVEPAWESIDVRDIRNAHVLDLKLDLVKKGYRMSYVKVVVSIAMAFLGHLKERGDIKELPARPDITIPKRDLWILDAAQQENIISGTPRRHHVILRLLAKVGSRPCEVCALKCRDFVGGHIYIQRSIDDEGNISNHTKTNEVYRKPIPADLAGDLAEAIGGKLPEAFVFTNRRGLPFRPGSLSRAWKRSAIAQGFDVTLGVGTRHAFATRTWKEEESAARERTAQRVGHASPAVTFRHYVGNAVVRELSVGDSGGVKSVEKKRIL